jgi:hypothetical protein
MGQVASDEKFFTSTDKKFNVDSDSMVEGVKHSYCARPKHGRGAQLVTARPRKRRGTIGH